MKFRSAAVCCATFAALSMSACGGGGGSGSDGSSSTPGISVSALVTQFAVSASQTTTTVQTNFPDSVQWFQMSYSTAGIEAASATASSKNTVEIGIDFKAPFTLAPGVYEDTIQLRGCEDSECVRTISAGAKTLHVRYTVKAATGADAPTVTFSPPALDLHYLVTDPGPIRDARFNLSFTHAPVAPHIEITHSRNALLGVVDGGGTLTLDLKWPEALGPGVHEDTLTLKLCLDSNCVNPFPGSPYTLNVRYTVTNQVEGTAGYKIDLLPIEAVSIAADPVRGLVYVGQEHSIAVLDPASGATTRTVSIDGQARKLAVSDDGQFLYASVRGSGTVQRFILPAMTPDIQIPLGTHPSYGYLFEVNDIQVAPGQPHTLAVALRDTTDGGAGSGQGLVIYDDAIARPTRIPIPPHIYEDASFDTVQWGGTASTLYGNNWLNDQVYEASVDASGVRVVNTATGVHTSYGAIHWADGLLYVDDASIIDAASLAVVGRFPDLDCIRCKVTVDSSAARAFVGNVTVSGIGQTVQVYDTNTRTLIGQAKLPYQSSFGPMVRWGAKGLAMIGDVGQGQGVIVIQGNLVSP